MRTALLGNGAVWALAASLLLAPALLGAAAGAPSSPGLPSPPRTFNPGPFAARAGYDPTVDAQVLDVVPATGSTDLVVAFEPSNPMFYNAPAANAPAMTPAEIAADYGLSPAAYAAAEQYFQSYGLAVTHAWGDRLSLSLAGPVPAVERAFDTSLAQGDYAGHAVQFPRTPPALPAFLEPEVAGVVGLSAGFTTFTLPFQPNPASVPTAGTSSLITPGDARQIYGASGLYNYTGSPHFAKGETIVLLLWGDGYDPADLQTFFSESYPSTFPAVNYTAYPVDGAPYPSASALSDPSAAPQELTLDLEWAGSLAPGANLDAVYPPDGPASNSYSPSVASMTDALNEAVSGIPGVDVISMSFGTAEGSGGGLAAAWTNDIAEAMHERITMLAATGDNGGDASYSPCTGPPTPEFPAADPYVLAVGGSAPVLQTNPLGQVTGIASEPAWAGSGGGFSTEFADPAYQQVGTAAGPVEASGHRGIPDVAAAAANDYLYYGGAARSGQGTSFATPLWAGLIAEMDSLHGSSLGFVNGNLYAIGAAEPTGKIPTGLVDITSGANCLGPAGPGWDTATGWGSPRGVPLYADLTASIVNVSLATAPDPAPPGGSVTLSAQVTNQSDGAAVAGVHVLLSLTADTSVGICQGSFGIATPVTNATGVAAATFSIPACYLGTKAVASAQITEDGLYGAASRLVAVNLLGYASFLGPLVQPPYDLLVYVAIMGSAIAVGWAVGRPPRRGPPRPTGRSTPSSAPPAGAIAPDAPSASLAPAPISEPPADSAGPPSSAHPRPAGAAEPAAPGPDNVP